MSPSTAENVHPDFAHSTGLTLVSSDGVTFHIDSAALSRSSAFFRGMFTLPQGANQHQSIAVDEDASVLVILLKLASGLASTELEALASYDAVERVLSAADKYDMPGPTQVLRLVLRLRLSGRAAGQNPFQQYAIACKNGFSDLADELAATCASVALDWDNVPSMDGDYLARLMRLRQDCVSSFHEQIRSTTAGPFTIENQERCPCNLQGHRHSEHGLTGYHLATWKSFAMEACVQFSRTPSIDTVLSHPNVATIIGRMQYSKCNSYDHFFWSDIHSRVRQACAPLTINAGNFPELS